MKIFSLILFVLTFLAACGGDSNFDRSHRLVEVFTEHAALQLSSRAKYTYNESGYVTSISFDDGDDGNPDVVVTYFYNASNKVSKYENDWDLDGNADSRSTFYYNSDGLLYYIEYDNNLLDPQVDQKSYYFYNDKNQVVKVEAKDGFENLLSTYTYTYNDSGYITSRKVNGSISTRTYEFDESGNLLKRMFDSDNDGQVDITDNYTYEEGSCVIPEPVSFRSYICQ